MKLIDKILAVPMPQNIRRLPKDERGLPVPMTVAYDINGVPDFRVIDPGMWRRIVGSGSCGICGRRIIGNMAFVGGPRSMQSRHFTDAAMHHECATYAMQVCPFLAMPRFTYAKSLPKMDGVATKFFSDQTERPDYFGVGLTNDYKVWGGQDLILQANPWVAKIIWWKEGKMLPEEPKQGVPA